ncbi:hypothetical protein ID866_7953, partial [Astraeus odoratus]
MRPLTLHASALSDSEYSLYTSSLNDLCVSNDTDPTAVYGDAHYETMAVGVREARAWLRGRYQDLPASDIDDILKLFFPNLLPTDTLTGGQFFAALRLVVHAQSGNGIDRSLAFVQAHPGTTKSTSGVPRPPSPPKRPVKAPPSLPDRSKPLSCNVLPHETNPFTRRSTDHAAFLSSGSQGADTDADGPAAAPPRLSNQKISHNPFLVRDKLDGPEVRTKSPEKNGAKGGKLPPLPPRKPTSLAPLQRSSEDLPGPAAPFVPPTVPAKPSHITSPLMKQSLEASKQGQSMKRAEEQLDRERVLQILKTTSSSGAPRTRSLSPSKSGTKGTDSDGGPAPIPPRRRPPSSATSSTSSSLPSLDQVASASLRLSHPSPSSRPPPLPIRDPISPGSIPAPPTHPDRRTSTDASASRQASPTSRSVRSKSMHSTGAPPLPPPRRKRPESVQLSTTSDVTDTPSVPPNLPSNSHSRTSSFQGLSRHLSLMRNREATDSSPM